MGRRGNKSRKVWRAKVARVAKSVTLRNQETKYYEYIGANTGVGGSSGLIPLYSNGGATSGSNIPYSDLPLDFIDVGGQKNQRIGNQITLKGMHIRGSFENDPASVGMTQARVILAWIDPNFSVSSISAGNLLYLPAATGNNVLTAQLKGPTHQDTIIRKVVMDRIFSIEPGNSVTSGGVNNQIRHKMFKINVPFHNKKYQFISGTAGINGEHEDLVMFMFAFQPGAVNTQQVLNVRITNRIYYKDG